MITDHASQDDVFEVSIASGQKETEIKKEEGREVAETL